MSKLISVCCQLSNGLTRIIDGCSPLVTLGIRSYIAYIFLASGWQKITSWESTLLLFQYEYQVMFLSPKAAAIVGTAAELILPIFLILGLGARVPALLLFIFNYVSIIAYPAIFTPEYSAALKQQIIWGLLIAWVIFKGHEKISLDYCLQAKVCKNYRY